MVNSVETATAPSRSIIEQHGDNSNDSMLDLDDEMAIDPITSPISILFILLFLLFLLFFFVFTFIFYLFIIFFLFFFINF